MLASVQDLAGPLVWAVVAVWLVASLAPFRLDLPRRVDNGAVVDGATVVLERPGVVNVPSWSNALLDGASHVEVDVIAAAAGPQSGPARIVSLSSDIHRQDLVIGQSRDRLVVRVRRPGSSPQGSPALLVPRVFADDLDHHVHVDVTPTSLSVDVDGIEVAHAATTDPLAEWDPSHVPLLGNEHGGTRPWLGTIRRAVVTVDGQVIDLVAAGVAPAAYWQLPDRWSDVLARPLSTQLSWTLLFHAAAMLALGFLAARRWPGRGVVIAAWCGGLSLVTLIAKSVVATRHPGMVDLVVELTAACLGIWVAHQFVENVVDTTA